MRAGRSARAQMIARSPARSPLCTPHGSRGRMRSLVMTGGAPACAEDPRRQHAAGGQASPGESGASQQGPSGGAILTGRLRAGTACVRARDRSIPLGERCRRIISDLSELKAGRRLQLRSGWLTREDLDHVRLYSLPRSVRGRFRGFLARDSWICFPSPSGSPNSGIGCRTMSVPSSNKTLRLGLEQDVGFSLARRQSIERRRARYCREQILNCHRAGVVGGLDTRSLDGEQCRKCISVI